MNALAALPAGSRVTLYCILGVVVLYTGLILWAQIGCLRGNPFENPDGTRDDWREQKIFYGIAMADILVACPSSFVAVTLTFVAPMLGLYLMGMVGFWFVWANIMTTLTSLRFEKPRITIPWIFVFPLGSIIGLAYIIWMLTHFDVLYNV